MNGGYWMIRTTRSGKVVEKSQFFVGERKPRRDRKKGSSSLSKKDRNLSQAVRRLARILNCNFSHGDLLLTLTYDESHYTALSNSGDMYKAAEKAATLFWRRLWRILSQLEVKIRGVWMTADKDAETGEAVRLHHHLVVGREGLTLNWQGGRLESVKCGDRDLSAIWGQGYVDVETLREQDDYTPLASYFVRQAVGGEDKKKWHTSRGLLQPVIESEKIVDHPRELRAPGGADVKEISHYDVETGTHYMRYIRRPRKIIAKESDSGGVSNF